MNIKPAIYENLTIQERVIASVEALARDDEEEKQRLVKSCPKKTYTMSDYAYSGKMEALQDMAMVVECDMRGCALNFFMLLYLDDHLDDDKHKGLHKLMQKMPCQIQEMISIKQAWHDFLEEEGINPAMMDKAYKPVRHFAIEFTAAFADEMKFEPDPETVEKYRNVLKEYMDRVMGE